MNKPTLVELEAFFAREFAHADFSIIEAGQGMATLRREISTIHTRPGGTVSGPTIMELADAALYVAILAEIGLVALAVTSSLNFNFLRKHAADRALIAQCRLLKLGRSLAMGEVSLFSEGLSDPVAHATGTYSLPPTQEIANHE